MSKYSLSRNTTMVLLSLMILVIVGVVALALTTGQGFTLFSQTVYEPQFSSIQCGDSGQNAQLQDQKIPDSGKTYTCPFSNSYNPEGCIFILSADGILSSVGEEIITCTREGLCQDTERNLGTPVLVGEGGTLWVNPSTITGSMYIRGEADMFGLLVELDNGFDLPPTSDCTLNSLNRDYDFINSKSNFVEDQPDNSQFETDVFGDLQLRLGERLNVVTAVAPVQSVRVIQRGDVNNNQPIYIEQPGVWRPIKEIEGNLYVDPTKVTADDRIECIPRLTPQCTDEATWEEDNIPRCDDILGLGNYGGYVPVSGDKSCLFVCNSEFGSPEPTDQCITRASPDTCPDPQKPFYNGLTGECVGGDPGNFVLFDQLDGRVILWILGFALLITLILIIRLQNKRRR